MPNNISTNFNEFVNENVTKTKRVNKLDVKKIVFECLSNSDKKLNLHDISVLTGHKTDNVYIALVDIPEVKAKRINDMNYWYINDSQVDPVRVVKTAKPVDPFFMRMYENDVKNNPNNRTVFLSAEERMQYSGVNVVKSVKAGPRKKAVARKAGPRTKRKI